MHEALRKFKANIFQALAHPTRIAIVEMLRDGEVPVSHILERLRIDPANASQHLAVLRGKNVVLSRKEGTQVFYSLRDPILVDVLDIMRRYFESHLTEALSELSELTNESRQTVEGGA
jgi:ArsR family transcriptional regulator